MDDSIIEQVVVIRVKRKPGKKMSECVKEMIEKIKKAGIEIAESHLPKE